jgi:hypothetical protein
MEKEKSLKILNNMCKNTRYAKDYCEEDYYTFHGDGEGDFEDYAERADLKICFDYIDYCKKQIDLAHEYIKQFRDSRETLGRKNGYK